MCKGFRTNLTGLTLRCCISLSTKSIRSLAELSNAFILKFANDCEEARYLNHPYKTTWERYELLRNYFEREGANPLDCDTRTIAVSLNTGPLHNPVFRAKMTRYPR